MSGNAWQALVVSLVPLLILWRGLHRPDEALLRRWSTRFGVVLDHESRLRITAALRRGRVLRASGAAIGAFVASMPAYMNLIDPSRSSDFAGPAYGLAPVYGAALGATLAEIVFVQRPVGPRRASLERRTWRQYVRQWPVRLTVAAAALAVAVAPVGMSREVPRTGEAVAAAAAAVAACGLLAVGLRRIVARPLLSTDGPLRDVDEAIRADGAHRLAAATMAMAVLSAASVVTTSLWDRLPLLVLAVVVFEYLVLGWWWYLSRDVVWRVDARRRLAAA